MKDLDDFDLHEKPRDQPEDESRPDLEVEGPEAEGPEAGSADEWHTGGPTRLEDDAGGLPDLPPDVSPERPLIPPLTYLLLVLVAVPILLYLALRPTVPEPAGGPEAGATPLGLAPTPAPEPAATPEASPPPLDLPSLDDSDAAVRELIAAVSPHPGLAEWLSEEQLVRTFVVAVENVADGESPAPHLGFLAPEGSFRVRDTPRGPVLDPASFARYDEVTSVVTSLDAGRVARRLRDLAPLTEAAYRELGHPDGGFEATLKRALDKLIETPVPAPGAALQRLSVAYAWDDPRLESLDPAQKHLLRMGPENQAAVQAWLKSLRDALSADAAQAAPAG